MQGGTWTIGSIAQATGGTLSPGARPDVEIGNFHIIAWSCNAKSCFLTVSYPPLLDGGNKMVQSAIERQKARVALVDDATGLDPDLPWIKVDDVNVAAAILSQTSRDQFQGKLVGITGTAGKSSTKTMLGHVLKQAGSTWVTTSNQNLTPHVQASLASIAPTTKYAVMEIGLYAEPTVRDSAAMAQPHVGVITSIGLNHAASFDDPVTGILKAKTDLLRHLTPGGTAVLPGFSDRYEELLDHAKQSDRVARIITCGKQTGSDIQLVDISRRGEKQRATIAVAGKSYAFDVPYMGTHMVENAVMVAGAVLALDLPLDLMTSLDGAPRPHSAARRYKVDYRGKIVEIIDDSFNTGPLAITAMAEHAATRSATRKYLVIGDIRGLEEDGHALHTDLAAPIDAAKFDHVFTVGPGMKEMAGALKTPSTCFGNRFTATNAMLDALADGDLVFIKGSAAMKFKDVIAHIKKKATMASADPEWVIEDQ